MTGLVHFVLLRPLLDLDGADYVADKLLHMVVPVLAVVGWAVFGPRPRFDRRSFWWVLAWPLAWLAETLVVGGATGWYPYPFLDHREDGLGPRRRGLRRDHGAVPAALRAASPRSTAARPARRTLPR